MSPLEEAMVAILASQALFVVIFIGLRLSGDEAAFEGPAWVILATLGAVWIPIAACALALRRCVVEPLRLMGGWGGIDPAMGDYERSSRSIRTLRRTRWLWVYVYTLRGDRPGEDGTKIERAVDSLIITLGAKRLGLWVGRRSKAYPTGRSAGASRRTLKRAVRPQETP